MAVPRGVTFAFSDYRALGPPFPGGYPFAISPFWGELALGSSFPLLLPFSFQTYSSTPGEWWPENFSFSNFSFVLISSLYNQHLQPDFVQDVIAGKALSDPSMLAFRDPRHFLAGQLHNFHKTWLSIA